MILKPFTRKGGKKNDESRGKYAAVAKAAPQPHDRLSFTRKLIQSTPMFALWLIGVALILTHHFFYTYLNGKSIDPLAEQLPAFLRNQKYAKFVGTAIAHATRIVLSMAFSFMFTQLLWISLRLRYTTIRKVDAVVNCGNSPFQYSALQALKASPITYYISLLTSATALVVVFTPGSLTISFDNIKSSNCTVPSVPQVALLDNNTNIPSTRLPAVMANILATNSYLPPFQTTPSRTCGYATCSYSIPFVGPSLHCLDVTSEMSFISFLNQTDAPPAAPFPIWNTTRFINETSFGINILSRDLLNGILKATQCTVLNSTFAANVTLERHASLVQAFPWANTSSSNISMDNSFLSIYAQIGVTALEANLFAGPNGYKTDASSSSSSIGGLQSNPFFATTPSGNHTFSEPPESFVESFMQNVAISLLSGDVYYGISNDTSSNLERVTTTCTSPTTVYVYDDSVLWSTYTPFISMVAFMIPFVCWIAKYLGLENTLVFSDILRMALNEQMMGLSGRATGNSWMKLLKHDNGTPGKLVTLSPADEDLNTSTSQAPPPIDAKKQHMLGRFGHLLLIAIPWKMVLPVLAAICCMMLNHAYYSFLAGKAPNAASGLSLLDQSVVSGIGIALAYAFQTLLAFAIKTSCVQIFWRNIRSMGHTISQIDALVEIQAVISPRSVIRALRGPRSVPFLSLLSTSTSLVSIYAPGSIKFSTNSAETMMCTVLSPRNLTEIETTFVDYSSPIAAGILSGTYLQPASPCPQFQCNYKLEFVGPGFDCQDVTISSNETAFVDSSFVYHSAFSNQTGDMAMSIFVQTWDANRLAYQAANCTGVSRSYSISITTGNYVTFTSDTTDVVITIGDFDGPPTLTSISVIESRILTTVYANLSRFADAYLYNMMLLLSNRTLYVGRLGGNEPDTVEDMPTTFPFSFGSGLGRVELDGSISMAENMTLALEEFAQNSTLSLLSDTVFAFNSENPSVLENITTPCTYPSIAYEYSPHQLFATYGVSIFVTTLCAIWGTVAAKRNGVEESLDFSRILRAVLNQNMFDARDNLDKDTVIKAADTREGSLYVVSSDS